MLKRILLHIRYLFQKSRLEDEMSEELRFHLEKQIEDNVKTGMSPLEARRVALRDFGGVEQIKEKCRDTRGTRFIEEFWQDMKYGLRILRRYPGFTLVAVLTLALGIGANSAIFSLINAAMLRPLPVEHPEQLIQITRMAMDGKNLKVSYPLFEYFRDHLQSISTACVYETIRPIIHMDGKEETVTGALASGSYYSLLGLKPAAGRLLEESDDTTWGASPVAVISDRYWRLRFGRDPAAIGKKFAVMKNTSFEIVGVAPPGFSGISPDWDPDVTIPLSMGGANDDWKRTDDFNFLNMMARLRPGLSLEQAKAEVRVLYESRIRRQASKAQDRKELQEILRQRCGAWSAIAGLNTLRWRYGESLGVLMTIVALVLLLACANLSGLLVARAASREREISIRRAIGAGRGRLVRQFLTESFLLAALGGLAGLLLSQWLSTALVAMLGNGELLMLPVRPDWRVVAFTGAISLVACLLAGLAPARHAARGIINPALKEVRGGRLRRLGRGLVISQLSISMVLLVGAILFIGTLAKLYQVDNGFRSGGVLTFGVRTTEQYPPAKALAIQTTLVERLSALPGILTASAVQTLPIAGGLWTRAVHVEGYSFGPDEDKTVAYNVVAPKYFETMGTPLVLGREFDRRDGENSKKVGIVNESFARRFFRSSSALVKNLTSIDYAGEDDRGASQRSALGRNVTSVGVTIEIVGVVKDAKYQNLRAPVVPTLYIPWTQRPGEQPTSYSYLFRVAGGDPLRLVHTIEGIVRETDSSLRFRSPQTLDSIIDQSIVKERIMATLGGFFGLLALIIACMGIFGVMAFQVSRRTHEFGIRLALGAAKNNILSQVLSEVMLMILAGLAIGCLVALGLSRFATTMLFGVTATDPAVFALSAAILAAAALAAAYVPARRAARVDPMVALRNE